ncbi:hypothetical protein C3B78_11360 [Arthrobacter sp. PGP41]|nr:hypothetical protein C3B78_11360 [Arthrobacter sp. PGP41]
MRRRRFDSPNSAYHDQCNYLVGQLPLFWRQFTRLFRRWFTPRFVFVARTVAWLRLVDPSPGGVSLEAVRAVFEKVASHSTINFA